MPKNLSFHNGIAWLVVVTVFLIIPGSLLPRNNWLDRIWFDKWIHVGLFAILVVSWHRVFFRIKKVKYNLIQCCITVAFVCFCYGIVMEFIQENLIQNRLFEWYDIVANAIGCILGALFVWRRYIKYKPL